MYPHRRVVGALVLTISASRSEQIYHTDVFSLSGYRSVFVATRRRSSQATGPLVVAIRQLIANELYQYMNVIVKIKLSYFVDTRLDQLTNMEREMESISNATILTLAVTICLAALNFFFGIHGRLKKFTNERISVYKEILSLEDSNEELSDAKKIAKKKLKEQVFYELTKIKCTLHATLMLEIMKNNPYLDTKKEASVRTIIDCLDKKVVNLSPSITKTTLSLNRARFRSKQNRGIFFVVFYIILAIIFSQASFSLSENKEHIPLAVVTGCISIFMLIRYTFNLIYYPVLGSFKHYKKLISILKV